MPPGVSWLSALGGIDVPRKISEPSGPETSNSQVKDTSSDVDNIGSGLAQSLACGPSGVQQTQVPNFTDNSSIYSLQNVPTDKKSLPMFPGLLGGQQSFIPIIGGNSTVPNVQTSVNSVPLYHGLLHSSVTLPGSDSNNTYMPLSSNPALTINDLKDLPNLYGSVQLK